MAITQQNTYVIGSNNDLTNALNNIDNNRIGTDLTWLENDGGTVKVSVGSLIESQGSLYAVQTTAETPTGTAAAGAYLFFDDSVPSFVWSSTPGTYDPARGGIYDASDRRQCRFYLTSSTAWLRVVADEGNDIRHEGALTVDDDLTTDGKLEVNDFASFFDDVNVSGDLSNQGELSTSGGLRIGFSGTIITELIIS